MSDQIPENVQQELDESKKSTEQKPAEEVKPQEGEAKTFPAEVVEELRKENASWRTKFRELEEKLSKAKTPEEFDKAVTELREENLQLARKLAATEAKLPNYLADRLKGATPEELAADAKAIAEAMGIGKDEEQKQDEPPAPPSRSGGGLDGDAEGSKRLPDDPGKLADMLLPHRFI